MAKLVNPYGAACARASPHEVDLQELAACSTLWSPEGPFPLKYVAVPVALHLP